MSGSAHPVERRLLEIVPGAGLHPYYFNMTLAEVILISVGWQIAETSDRIESRFFEISLRRQSFEIDLEFQYRDESKSKSEAVLCRVATYQAKLPSGAEASKAAMDRIQSELAITLTEDSDPVFVDGSVEIVSLANPDRTFGIYRNRTMSDCVWMLSADAFPHPGGEL